MKKKTTFLFILTIFSNYFIYLTFADKFLVNEFYDKTIPEAEIPLSVSSIRNRREVFEINFKVGEESGPSNRNALYNRGYFEGDIATNGLSSNTIKEFLGEINAPRGVSRNAVRNPAEKWPKNGEHVLIPVAYSSQYTQKFIYKIERAMREFHNRTCIRFIPKTSSHIDYIYVTPEKFCHSEVGRKGGKQILSLTGDCIRGSEGVGAIIHELMHTIGFYHEQSRADRNNYVTIHLENVLDGAKENFDTYDLEKITHLGTSYDYESILHYDMYAFSKNGRPTIVPTKPGVTIGQRRGFSSIDVYKINKLYECRTNQELQQSISSSCPTQYSNLDIVENNLFHKPGEISDCCNFCTATKGCRAYAWSYYIGGMCTLKSALGPTISNPTIKMGILNSGGTCTKQIGTDIIEQVLAYRVGEEYQCCDFCKETKGCEAYTFNQYDGGMCWLKHADVPLIQKDGIKSGINAHATRDIKIANTMGAGVQVTATCFSETSPNTQEIFGPIILQDGDYHWFSFHLIVMFPIRCMINSTISTSGLTKPKNYDWIALSNTENFAVYFLRGEGLYRSKNYDDKEIWLNYKNKFPW